MLMPLTVLLNCNFVEQMTPPTMAYVAALLAGSIVGILVLRRFLDQLPARLGIMALGILIFEMFTAPMWLNERLGTYAYVYHDVSWVMTLAWSVALLAIATFVDRRWPAARAWQSFAITLAIFTPLAVLEELAAVRLGIRSSCVPMALRMRSSTNICTALGGRRERQRRPCIVPDGVRPKTVRAPSGELR